MFLSNLNNRWFLLSFLLFLSTSNVMASNELGESLEALTPMGWVILSVWLFYLLVLFAYTLRYTFKVDETIPELIPKKIKIKAKEESVLFGDALSPVMTRRSFITLLGWAWIAFTAATMGALSTCLRFFFPNVTFEPPLKFKVGFPDQFSIGVDNRFKDEHRVWIVRNEQGFYALSTICTHLGCTPNWLQSEQKFKCPCHGSGYYVSGINFEGPAPRPLERFNIALADDGQILVDESQKYQYELGQWTQPGAFLEYKA
jgi:cytochrome b6-f complex iron-sulfur subunit